MDSGMLNQILYVLQTIFLSTLYPSKYELFTYENACSDLSNLMVEGLGVSFEEMLTFRGAIFPMFKAYKRKFVQRKYFAWSHSKMFKFCGKTSAFVFKDGDLIRLRYAKSGEALNKWAFAHTLILEYITVFCNMYCRTDTIPSNIEAEYMLYVNQKIIEKLIITTHVLSPLSNSLRNLTVSVKQRRMSICHTSGIRPISIGNEIMDMMRFNTDNQESPQHNHGIPEDNMLDYNNIPSVCGPVSDRDYVGYYNLEVGAERKTSNGDIICRL
jgi:hypothetical protein